MTSRNDFVERIIKKREQHADLPGLEFDVNNGPNEWMAIIAHYLFEDVRRGKHVPTREDFEDNMETAASVILAALEHSEHMQKHERLL